MLDAPSWDAEALFRRYDTEKTQLLTRGALTELLRSIGLEKRLGKSFPASSRLAFDAHSADAHFLALQEFKQLYYHISFRYPQLLPRETLLSITIMSARDLPSTDPNGKSDPFCTVVCCKTDSSGKVLEEKKWSKSTTKVIEKTLNPFWGEDFTDKYGYEEGDSLVFHVYDWDKGDRSELVGKVILPSSEFHRPGGFLAWLPITLLVTDAPKGLKSFLRVRVAVRGMPAPPPRLRAFIHSATDLPLLDANRKGDPFCTFQIVAKPFSKGVTKPCPKTSAPVWNEEFDGKHRYDDGDDLLFEVRDFDGKGKSELLGRCLIPNVEFAKMGGFHGDVPLSDVPKASQPAKGNKPTLKLTVFLSDMMPSPVDAAALCPADMLAATAAPPVGIATAAELPSAETMAATSGGAAVSSEGGSPQPPS